MSKGGEKVLCITTGGSIDKTYSALVSSFVVGSPSVKSILRTARCGHRVRYVELCRKDSLELTHEDRAEIVKLCRDAEERCIVIVHGTDTMAETAAVVKPVAVELGKKCVITGAIRPEAFKESDASYNIGSAFTIVPYLDAGCHVVFHSMVFSEPETIVKNAKKDIITSSDHQEPTPTPPTSEKTKISQPSPPSDPQTARPRGRRRGGRGGRGRGNSRNPADPQDPATKAADKATPSPPPPTEQAKST